MKKLICLAALSGMFGGAYAQNTFPTGAGTNVGIGTTSPTSKLHVVDAAGTGAVQVQTSTNGLNETIGIAFGTQSGDQKKAAILGINTNTSSSAGALALYTHNGTSLAERLRITSDGYVGIGTSSPTSLLSVGGVSSVNDFQQVGIRYSPTITSGTGGALSLQMMANPASASTAILNGVYMQMGTTTGSTAAISQMNGVVTSLTHRGTGNIGTLNNFVVPSPVITSTGTVTNSYGLVIRPQQISGVTNGYGVYQSGATDINYFNGKLGIGTTTPQIKLTVLQNNSTIPGALIQDSGTGDAGLSFNVSGASYTWGIDQSDGKKFKLSNASELGTNDLITAVGSAGFVGIGTTDPKATLAVGGSLLTGDPNISNIDPSLTNGNLNYLNNSSKMLIGWNRSAGAGETDFIANQGLGSSGGFAFYNHDNSGTETKLMWMRGDGNVVIGADQPVTGYKLAVNGNIIATGVTVKVKSDWPDYVFAKGYKLPELSEVKSFIDKNHHLPGMPSDKEVAANGLDLGEINKNLTQKVEELTLYAIKSEQEKKQLLARLDKMQQQINKKIRK